MLRVDSSDEGNMSSSAYESSSASNAQKSASWKDLLVLFFGLVIFRAMITSIGFLSASMIDHSDPNALGMFAFRDGVAWLACDSEYYCEIARNGYPTEGYERRLIAFFPGYPLVTQLVAPFTSVENAMRIVSQITGVLATLIVFAWAHRVGGRRVAWITVVLVSVSTSATFLSAGLADSLFFFWTALTLYCVTRRWFWLAALTCAGATATRPNGLALAAMLGAVVLFTPTYSTITRRFAMACVFGFIGYSSALIYQGVLWARHDDPKIYFTMQKTWVDDYKRDHVERRAAEMNAIDQTYASKLDRIMAKAKNRIDKPGAWNKVISYGLVVLTLAALAYPPPGLHRAWFVLPLFIWLLVQVPDGGFRMNSLHRYMLAAPMLWLWVATTFDRKRWRWVLVSGALVSLSVQCYYAWMFTRGVWCG